jgi:peptide/nickel transport system substrate-binding protein
VTPKSFHTLARSYLLLLLALAACLPAPAPGPRPLATPLASTPLILSNGRTSTPSDLASPTPPHAQTPTPPQSELTICLLGEPQSLYAYGLPEPGREHILAALYDGPIDTHGFTFEPVMLRALPSLADGSATLRAVSVQPGDLIVDALGRVVSLTAGVELPQIDGSRLAYSGAGPASLPQLSATFRLRPGVLWSDGVPLTADDSVFAFLVARSPDSYDPRRAVAERTLSYMASDPFTVVWTGLPGYVDPLYPSFFWSPLPRHRFSALSPVEVADSPEARRSPLGWGPFALAEWAGDRLVLQRNPYYWRAAEGLPRLERLVYRFMPGPADLLRALASGECQVAPSGLGLADLAGDLRAAEAAGAARLYQVSGATLEQLVFGLSPADDYARPAGNGFFQDTRARHAVAYCLDRAALAAAVGLPPEASSAPPGTYLPPGHPLLAPDVLPAPFRPDAGRALLADLGWTDSDLDGVLDRGTPGTALNLTLAGGPLGDPLRERLTSLVAEQLRSHCGIGVEVLTLTRGELEADWPAGPIFGRRFDLAVFGWRIGPVPPCDLFTSAQIPGPANPAGANAAGYANPDYDRACQHALSAADPAAASAAHAEAQRDLARDLPFVPLLFRPRLAATRPEVDGYALDASSPSELWNIEQLTLAP